MTGLHQRLLDAAVIGSAVAGRSCVDADEAVPIAAALRAVLELHEPVRRHVSFEDDEGWTTWGWGDLGCDVCTPRNAPNGADVWYPCKTVRAVASGLGVEVDG